MSHENVANFPTTRNAEQATPPDQAQEQTDTVSAVDARYVGQTNSTNLALEQTTHQQIMGLPEKINTLTVPMQKKADETQAREAEFKQADQQATHVPFIAKWLLQTLMLLIFLGEWKLAATVLEGMNLATWETYLMSASFVGVAFAVTKAVAHGARWLVSEHHKTPGEKWANVFFLVGGLVVLAVMVYAMSEARVVYGAAENSLGTASMNDRTAHGLTLLSAVLYFGQIVVFWFLQGSNPKADRARVNYERALKELRAMHKQRAQLASKLNLHVNKARAKFEENIEDARADMAEYRRCFVNAGGTWPANACQEIRRDWFNAPSDRLSPPVDAMPPLVQDILARASAIEPSAATVPAAG